MAKAKTANRFTTALDTVMAEVAREYGVDINTHECEHVATHLIAQRHILARMLRGDMRHGDVDNLKTVDALLAPYKAKRDRTRIEVRIVEGVYGIYKCKHCGEQNELEPDTYTPLPDRPAAKPKPAPVEAAPIPVPTPALKPDNVVVQFRENGTGSAIHDVVVPGGIVPPLKRDQPQYGTGNSISPMSVDGSYNGPGRSGYAASVFSDPNPTRKV
jgi:hypothetical protein